MKAFLIDWKQFFLSVRGGERSGLVVNAAGHGSPCARLAGRSCACSQQPGHTHPAHIPPLIFPHPELGKQKATREPGRVSGSSEYDICSLLGSGSGSEESPTFPALLGQGRESLSEPYSPGPKAPCAAAFRLPSAFRRSFSPGSSGPSSPGVFSLGH